MHTDSSLPIITLNNDERWSCHQCGHCCRGSIIPLSKADLERLQQQRWEDQPDYRQQRLTVRSGLGTSGLRLAHRADGSCVFLSEDGLCRIHSKFGIDAKPTVCQTFPLQLIPHEKQAILTLRRACPSAAADRGAAVKENLPFAKRLVQAGELKAATIPAPLFKSGEHRDWKCTSGVLESAAALLRDPRYPPVRRVVHTLQFASLMAKAKTKSKNLSDSQVLELSSTLAELVPEEAKPFFTDRLPPKRLSKIFFRLAATDCARLHPEGRHRSKWSTRFQLMQAAMRIVHGSGLTPAVGKPFPAARFDELEKPLGPLAPEIYLPLTRFLETTSASYLYALADRSGWSVIESVRGLALLFPVGLWLLRWVSYGREPTAQDMINIVVALDRSQGYAPLGGALHRGRLSILAFNDELERLAVRYAQ